MQAININKVQQGKFKLFENICKMEKKRSDRPYLRTPWITDGTVVATDGRVMAWAPLSYFDLPENVTDGIIDIKKGVMLYKEGGLDNRPDWKRAIPEDRELIGDYQLGGGGTSYNKISAGMGIAKLLLDGRVPVDVEFLQMVKEDVTAYKSVRNGHPILTLEAGLLNVLIMGFIHEPKDEIPVPYEATK